LVGCELRTQDEKIRQKSEEMFDRLGNYFENTLRDARKEGLIETKDFSAKSQAIYCFILGRLLPAKVKNDPEVLRNLSLNILDLIGAANPA
jgi:hypothetical protein